MGHRVLDIFQPQRLCDGIDWALLGQFDRRLPQRLRQLSSAAAEHCETDPTGVATARLAAGEGSSLSCPDNDFKNLRADRDRVASVAALRGCSGSYRNCVRLPSGMGVQLRRESPIRRRVRQHLLDHQGKAPRRLVGRESQRDHAQKHQDPRTFREVEGGGTCPFVPNLLQE